MGSGKRMEKTLKELLIGIMIFEVVAWLAGVFFVNSALKYSIGLFIGAVMACACAYHMWWSLDKNISVNSDNEGGAKAYSIRSSLLRYVVIAVVFAGLCLTDFSYPLAAFLGIMGLKVGAYLQPIVSKFSSFSK